VDFDARGERLRLITYAAFVTHLKKKEWEYNEALHHLFIDFKQAYDSIMREILYNILIEFLCPRNC